jgi:hypothetical protein
MGPPGLDPSKGGMDCWPGCRSAGSPLCAALKLPVVRELQPAGRPPEVAATRPPPCGPIQPWLPVTANPEHPFVHFNTASPHSSHRLLLWCFVWSRYLVRRINLRAESVGGRVVVISWWIWFYRGANFVGRLLILTLQLLNAL